VKALTISQPFASFIADSAKWVENRTWRTGYRGPLAIHAGRGTQYLTSSELAKYPTGQIIAVARLAACMPLDSMRLVSPSQNVPGSGKTIGEILAHEHTEGPWCWILADVRKLEEPIAITGAQGLWDWRVPADELARLV
jgi:hypothetical protein